MRTPASLQGLADYGLIDEVIRPLMSGKEAQIYLVVSQGEERVAKVYREAEHRDFKHRAEYTEGRTRRNTRDQRAMAKRSRYGREQDEAAWRAAEVDMIYRLSAAGVRVPKPHHFVDSVLIMELVQDAEGNPAPRLGDLDLGPEEAERVYEFLLQQVVAMLCAGVVHGDLSDFNVLMDANGPVIIDFPQSVDASANSAARKLLLRDVDNLHSFIRRAAPHVRTRPYAQEMWDLYQRGELTADTRLRGQFQAASRKVDTEDVIGLVRDADADELRRRQGPGAPAEPRRRRTEVVITPPTQTRRGDRGRGRQRSGAAAAGTTAQAASKATANSATAAATDNSAVATDKPRRRRRRGRRSGGSANPAPGPNEQAARSEGRPRKDAQAQNGTGQNGTGQNGTGQNGTARDSAEQSSGAPKARRRRRRRPRKPLDAAP